jgi:hypothetical protein
VNVEINYCIFASALIGSCSYTSYIQDREYLKMAKGGIVVNGKFSGKH